PRIGDTRIDHAPGIDEAARPQGMARHRRTSGLEKSFEVPEVHIFDELHRGTRDAFELTVLADFDPSGRWIGGDPLAVCVPVVVCRLLRHVDVHVTHRQAWAFAGAGRKGLTE